LHGQGTGKAGGYGYDKPSAAFEAAMRSAGVEFDSGIAGVGDSAIREALGVLARYLNVGNFAIVESYA